MILLRVENLKKSFGGLVAVDELSFEVLQGEILGLIGPNGAGKSTLLNLITNHVAADGGNVLFSGKELTHLPRHKIVEHGIARTFQALTVFSSLSVMDNVAIGQASRVRTRLGERLKEFRFRGESERKKDIFRKKVEEVIDFVGIDRRKANTVVAKLPLLDQKKVAIATALASEPKLLLLDEPLAGLNKHEADDLLEEFRKLKSSGVTIVLIDHNLEAVMSICDRILVLHFGTLIMNGSPDEVLQSKKVSEVYLGV